MDGYTILTQLRQAIGESETSTWPNAKLSYECLYRAAVASADRSGILTGLEVITTVADQAAYRLNVNYLRLYLMTDQNQHYIKYDDGTSHFFLYFENLTSIVSNDASSSVLIPQRFSIKDSDQITQVTGLATSTGSLTNTYTLFGESLGKTTLTSTSTSFDSVRIGDIVHNTTDDSHGVVIGLVDTHNVVCALFEGTNNYFTSGDAFIINPQMRYEIYLDPPPSTSGHTFTVWYIKKPNPVYSAYERYDFPDDFNGLVSRAAWEYKYRDREPNYGDRYYTGWDMGMKRLGKATNRAKQRKGFGVNFVKPASSSYTFRR